MDFNTITWHEEISNRRTLLARVLEHQIPDLERIFGRDPFVLGVRDAVQEELDELDVILSAVGTVGDCKGLVASLRKDARNGGFVSFPADDYSLGLDEAADELEELLP